MGLGALTGKRLMLAGELRVNAAGNFRWMPVLGLGFDLKIAFCLSWVFALKSLPAGLKIAACRSYRNSESFPNSNNGI